MFKDYGKQEKLHTGNTISEELSLSMFNHFMRCSLEKEAPWFLEALSTFVSSIILREM